MNITILTENLVYNQGLCGEHGLSIFITVNNENILFDTGQTDKLINNANKLSLNLSDLKYTVLSHGHYDHTGGLKALLEKNPDTKIVMKPEVLQEKYSNSTGNIREIGIDKDLIKTANVVYAEEKIMSIAEGIHIITEIKKYTDFESDEKKLFIKKGEDYVLDPFDDELFMVIENTDKSITVITGCAHNGIINILKTAKEHFPDRKIRSVIGGFHLKGKSRERIEKTIVSIREMGVEEIYINHCSGIEFYTEMKKKDLDMKVEYAYTGYRIELS